jgi:hypothetical protein
MYGWHKYVSFDGGYAVIFPSHLTHRDVSYAIERMTGDAPVSAGFVSRSSVDGKLHAEGESISLKLKSNPEVDDRYLNKLVGG